MTPTELIKATEALLALDAKGALVPHGIGGHARTLLTEALSHIAAQDRRIEEMRRALEDISRQKRIGEMDEDAFQNADWAGGFDEAVRVARAALKEPTDAE